MAEQGAPARRARRLAWNKVTIAGNLVKDPELTQIPNSGVNVCNADLAINESIKKKDGTFEEKPHFIPLTAWGQLAEKLATCHKGDNIILEGRLNQEVWEKDGERRSKLKVVASYLRVLSDTVTDDGDNSGDDSSLA